MAVLEVALLAGVGLLLARGRRIAGAVVGGADFTPTTAERSGWVQLRDGPGLAVRSINNSWTTPAVARVVQAMARAAEALGGQLQVADVGQKQRGAEFKPHLSHRWGRDLDLGYTLGEYPTPPTTPVDPRIVEVLAAADPWIEVVGVNESRAEAFAGAPFRVETWSGHVGHLHLRLRPELTVEPRSRSALLWAASREDD